MSETMTTLGPKDAWIERVLGVRIAGTQSPEPPDLRGRLNETGLRLREMRRTEQGPALTSRFTEAVNAMKLQDWPTVEDILDEIEPLMVSGLSAARGEEASSVVRAANAWRNACTQLRSSIAAFKATLLATLRAEDEHLPEELDDISDQLDALLDPIAARLSVGLADQVDIAINASGERQQAAVDSVLANIAKLESDIGGDEMIKIADGNGLEQLNIASAALGALATLRQALAERAGR